MSGPSGTPQMAQFGVIGLGVMGKNLALNLEDHGYAVALWTHTEAKVQRLLEETGTGRRLVGTGTLEEFTAALAPPRRILLMVKAGDPVDEMLGKLAPLLSRGDVVIDGGNSFFRDTQRREAAMRADGIHFVGMGVSGGEEGARYGPSLMPGGARAAYELLRPVLEAIAAKTDSGPCVTYVGPDGAGHYVKMIHNGIEYGVMQLIAGAYDLLRRGLGLPARIWKGGCIIRARLLDTLMHAFERAPDLPNLLLDKEIGPMLSEAERGWRRTVPVAAAAGIPVPAMSGSLAYFDSYRSARLPQNLTQAQRDFFGAHTYQRVDRPDAAFVHTDWQNLLALSPGGEQR